MEVAQKKLLININMQQTQREMILQKFKVDGYVTRNWALQRFCSRLGAIICDLNKEGYDITGENMRTEYGKDYVYKMKPKQAGLF